MKAIDILESLSVFKTRSEAVKWIAAGAVKINGVVVSLTDLFVLSVIYKIEIGKVTKFEKVNELPG